MGRPPLSADPVPAYRGAVDVPFVARDSVPARCSRCPFHVPEICDQLSGPWCTAGHSLCAGDSPTDEELIQRHQIETERSQPPTSFGLLFERHQRHVVAWACRMSGNYDLALELAQEVFVKVFRRLDAFRAESRFTTWLYTITRNCLRDYLKARAARPREVGDAALLTAGPVTANDGVAVLEAQSARRLVRRLIRDARLDQTEKLVIAMHYRDDEPLDAITAALGLTNASGAKAPIVSAKRKLRAAAARWTLRTQAHSRVGAAYG
jgi:RNA polymerase sigma-70 factor (ECF subfamily)